MVRVIKAGGVCGKSHDQQSRCERDCEAKRKTGSFPVSVMNKGITVITESKTSKCRCARFDFHIPSGDRTFYSVT